MWTRKLSVSMDQDDFLKAFVRALSDETVIRKMQHAVCGQLHKEVSELRDIIKSRDDRIAELEKKVDQLEKRQDDAEQYSRRNSVRVAGVPKGENEDVGQKILTLFNDTMKVTPPVTPDQIDRVHRVGPSRSDQPPSILVKFSTYRYRNKVFRAKKALKESNQSSDDKVFINEDLTKFRSNLLYLARNMKEISLYKIAGHGMGLSL